MVDTNAAPTRATLGHDGLGLRNSFYWLTFSSRHLRQRQRRKPTNLGTGFDVAQAMQGLDPSSVAFWLPNQDQARTTTFPFGYPNR